MALQDEILKALASGFGMKGLPLYNQEIPTNVLTGQPYFMANTPTSNDIGLNASPAKQISPALAVSQAISSVGNVNNQPQFNSREAMNSYNYTPASRSQGEDIQSYVKRLISAPTGAGQLSDQFMNYWAQANKSLPQNKEEAVGANTDKGKTTSDIGSRNPISTQPSVSFGNFESNMAKNRNLGGAVTPTQTNSLGNFESNMAKNRDISSLLDPADQILALGQQSRDRQNQEEAQRALLEEEQRKKALQYLAGLGY